MLTTTKALEVSVYIVYYILLWILLYILLYIVSFICLYCVLNTGVSDYTSKIHIIQGNGLGLRLYVNVTKEFPNFNIFYFWQQ